MKINQKLKNELKNLKQNKLKLPTSDKIKDLCRIVTDFKTVNKSNSIPPLLLADLALDGFTFRKIDTGQDYQLFIYQNGTYQPANKSKLEDFLDQINPNFRQARFHDIYRHIRASASLVKNTDQPGYLIPCQNGIWDRRAVALKSYGPQYFIKNKIATDYPDRKELSKIKATPVKNLIGLAKKPVTNDLLNQNVPYFVAKFFNAISDGDAGTMNQLWQEILDSLEPNYNHGKAVINYGTTGSNGKSNFTTLITSIIGRDQVATVNLNRLSDRYAVSNLVGKFANVSDDLGDVTYLHDDANLKTLITGGNILVEAKYKDPYTDNFKLVHIQNGNNLPSFQGKGNYVKRRLQIIPFSHHFKPGDPEYINNELMLRILESKPVREYVLYLALNQPRFYYYHETKASQKLLDLCIFKNDPVRLFLNELQHFKVDRIPRKLLFEAWKSFARANNFRSQSLSVTTFCDRFERVSTYEHKAAKFNNEDQVERVHKFLSEVGYHPVVADGTPTLNHTYRCYVSSD